MTLTEAKNVLAGLEPELSAAKDRKLQSTIDIRMANAAAESGDQRAKFSLAGLNKAADAAARLVLTLEKQLVEARRRVALAEGQRASLAAKSVASDGAERDKLFAVQCPGRMGRVVRHWHSSREGLQAQLEPGYVILHRIYGAAPDGTGGMVEQACRTVIDYMHESV